MSELQLFRAGVKPAIILAYKNYKKDEVNRESARLMGEYPYIIFEDANKIMFFRGIEEKVIFEGTGLICRKVSGGRYIKTFDQVELGKALGYPPLATNKWNYMNENIDKLDRCSVNYYGMGFVCLKEDVVECIKWLKENRPVSELLKDKWGGRIYVKHKKNKGG